MMDEREVSLSREIYAWGVSVCRQTKVVKVMASRQLVQQPRADI